MNRVQTGFSIWVFCLMLCGATAYAEVENFTLAEGESLPRSDQSRATHSEIEQVLSSEDFARKKTVKRWRAKDIKDKETRDESFPEWMIDFMEAMEGAEGFFEVLAVILKVFLWGLLIWLVFFLVLRYREQFLNFFSGFSAEDSEPELPTTMFGLDVQKTSLPKDVVANAQEQWIAGEKRAAVAVLLRASLIKLLHEYECRFFDSDTESECCERIEQQAPAGHSRYMWKLVRVWQQLAYAHRAPSENQFGELCTEWREVF